MERPNEIAQSIDHTYLKPDASLDKVKAICMEAKEHQFASVCIPPFFVKDAVRFLDESQVKVSTVVGFPMGYSTTPAKVEEVKRALDEGADEVDVVVNICAVKSKSWSYVKNDIESMTLAAHLKGRVIKVILEVTLVDTEELEMLCQICNEVEVDFVKTSTGMNGNNSTKATVELLKKNLDPAIKIKVSGGIDSLDMATGLLEAGATRIGTSKGMQIIGEVVS